jgi:hypothetical protein
VIEVFYDTSLVVPGTVQVSGNKITFTPTAPFANNMKYTVMLSSDIKSVKGTNLTQEYTFNFQSKFSPSYCSIDVIIDDISPWIGNLSRELIARYIYRSSVFADNMAVDAPMQPDPVTAVPTLTYEAQQFVRYDVDMKLIQLVYLDRVAHGGDDIQLGDFMIKKKSSFTPDLQGAYKGIRDNRQLFYDGIMGQHRRRYSKSRVASKGGNLTNPINTRTWESSSTSTGSSTT